MKFLYSIGIWIIQPGIWFASLLSRKVRLFHRGRKHLVKKKSRTDVEDVIIEYYKSHSHEDNTFKIWFNRWIERQRNCARSDNTILKYESDYRRFYEGYPLEEIDIRDIDEEILSRHFVQVLEEKQIPWRAFKGIMGYTKGTFEKAVREKIIPSNPFCYLDLELFKKYCYIPPVKTTTQRTLTENDTHILMDRIRNPRANNVNRICCFAIEMALYTGMRVGELAALMWDDIIFQENLMLIRRSEKFNRATKESTISITKTGKERVFPLTKEIIELLERVKNYEKQQGWFGEYIFQDAEGRVTKSKISDAMRNHTMSDDYSGIKSIHAIRRTINSTYLNC